MAFIPNQLLSDNSTPYNLIFERFFACLSTSPIQTTLQSRIFWASTQKSEFPFFYCKTAPDGALFCEGGATFHHQHGHPQFFIGSPWFVVTMWHYKFKKFEFFAADLKMAKISRLRVDLHCSYHIPSPWIFSKNTGGCPYMVLTRVPQKFSKFQINWMKCGGPKFDPDLTWTKKYWKKFKKMANLCPHSSFVTY